MKKSKDRNFDFREILCFSDVMDNLSELNELDIVPWYQIEAIKENKNSRVTIIEYQSSQVALIDSTLLISQESLEKFYPICLEILKTYRTKTESYFNTNANRHVPFECVGSELRNKFVNLSRSQDPASLNELVNLIEHIKVHTGYSQGEATKKILLENGVDALFLRLVELASKIMLCLNGELTLAFNIRIDLILLGVIKDLKGEIQIVQISLKKYRLSYIGWWYRLIVFKIIFADTLGGSIESLKQGGKGTIEVGDFKKIKSLWEDEYLRIVDSAKQKSKSYKLWEYMAKFQRCVILALQDTIIKLKKSDSGKQSDIATELEIFLIDQVIGYYTKAKELVIKDLHNNCVFEYLCQIMMLIYDMKIDEYLETDGFYKEFNSDHQVWVDKTIKYFEKMFDSQDDERKKWAGLTMIDFSKMESIRIHKKTVEEWDRYRAFQINMSTGGKNSKLVKQL